MKFSYNWISELVDGLDLAPRDLERLITMKTAECEGIEPVGALLEGASAATRDFVGADRRRPQSKGRRRNSAIRRQDRGVRRAELPRRYDDSLRSARQEDDSGSGKRRHAGLRRRARDQPRSRGYRRARRPSLACCRTPSSRSITSRSRTGPTFGAISAWRAKSRRSPRKPLRDPVKLDCSRRARRRCRWKLKISICARVTVRWFLKTSRCSPSPLWLQYRLKSIGLNPINNIVDFTNLIMAELGQPTHAFDRESALGRHDLHPARAQRANRSSRSMTNPTRSGPSNLVIADARGPVAIAGVIGGKETRHRPRLRERSFSKAPVFTPPASAKLSAQLKLRTDASMRFEKSQDPANTVRALARAVELLAELSPGIRLVGVSRTARAACPHPPPIPLPLDWLRRKLGTRRGCRAGSRYPDTARIPSRRARTTALHSDAAVLARHQRHLHARKIWWKKSAA